MSASPAECCFNEMQN